MKTKTTLTAILIITVNSHGASLVFDNGGGDSLFSLNTNWSPDTAITISALEDDFTIGSGFTVESAAPFTGLSFTTFGTGSITIEGTASLRSQWVEQALVTIDGGTLSVTGGANPLPTSILDFSSSNGGVVRFENENVADATAEHINAGKFTVGGSALDLNDANVTLVSDGGSGSILTVTPVPEPSSTALLGLGGLALILRRRK